MPDAECTICNQVITQPICVACLQDEMASWMRETRPGLVNEMKDRASELWIPRGDTRCVLCDTPMDVCAYCFTNYVLDWLSDHPELVPEFMLYFNYDLHYHGYGKELLELV